MMIVPFGTDVKVTLIPKIGEEIVPKETIKHLNVCVVRENSKKGFTPIYKVGDAGIEIEIQRHRIKYPGVYKIILDWKRPDAAYYDGYQDISNSCSFINFSTSCKVVSDNTANIEISPIYKGDDGRGIESITLTSTVGKTKTYTILYTDGTFTTFDVKDGEDGDGAGSGMGDMLKSIYDKNNDGIVDNASLVNGHSVESDVPLNAKFTDTVYVHPGSHDISFITGLQTALNSKVDKIAGKGLSTEDFTTGEKLKLAGLESTHFKGQFVTLQALIDAITNPVIGDYAYVDLGEGYNVVKYIWDSSDNEWVVQQGESTEMTPSEIKIAYESNPDTNAFTNSEKSKLSGIESGAQKNVQIDWNATSGMTSVQNKPDIPTKVSDLNNDLNFLITETDPTVPEWAKQPNKPTYTYSEVGALPANTPLFSGNYPDLSNKPTLGSLSAKNKIDISDIDTTGTPSGTTYLSGDGSWKAVGEGSANWGEIGGNIENQTDLTNSLNSKVDKILGKGLSDENYTLAEKNKLDNLAPVATSGSYNDLTDKPSVVGQVNSDWNASSGVEQILNKPAWIGSTKPTYTKSEIGLGNIDNTSDINKPVSTATQNALNAITNLIPSEANTLNKLADKEFVTNAIQTLASRYITYNVGGDPFPTASSLLSATEFYYQGELISDLILGDTALVSEDENNNNLQSNYYYDGNSWLFKYTIGSAFTPEQQNALDSGITATKVLIYDGYSTTINNKVDKVAGKGLSTEDYTTSEKNKLSGLATVATSGSYNDLSDVPSTFTPSSHGHNISEITDLQSKLNAKVDKVAGKQLSDENYSLSEKQKLEGLSNYDDSSIVLDLNNKVDKITGKSLSTEDYTTNEKNKLASITEIFTTILKNAYDNTVNWISINGTNLLNHLSDKSNPHEVTKSQIGLGDVDNTSDVDKPISTATQLALNDKVDKVTGKVLSDNNYTTVEKNKLAGLSNYDDSSVQSALNNKVDKVVGKQLSEENFTTDEKNKLAGLEEPNYRGTYPTELAISNINNPKNGNYALLDEGIGQDVIPYFYDESDDKWVPGGAAPELTPSQLKSLYESNPDTNAFTNSEKSKLTGIASGATANATNAQLRDRSTHTGSQSISTVTNLQTSLDDKVNNSRVLTDVPSNAIFTDTTYDEISESEINTGTSSTKRVITARRINFILSKASTLISNAISALTKSDVGLSNVDNIKQASKTEFDSHNSDAVKHITASERSSWNAKGSSNLALGETSLTAYRGDRGKTAYDHSQVAHAPSNAQKNSDITKAEIEAKLTGNITSHSHSAYVPTSRTVAGKALTGNITLAKGDVGLGNVDNTSDANKPVSTAQQSALNAKIDANKFQVVTELPASPTAGVFYFVKE